MEPDNGDEQPQVLNFDSGNWRVRESERDGFYCNSIVETYNLEALQCHRVSIELDAVTALNRLQELNFLPLLVWKSELVK